MSVSIKMDAIEGVGCCVFEFIRWLGSRLTEGGNSSWDIVRRSIECVFHTDISCTSGAAAVLMMMTAPRGSESEV